MKETLVITVVCVAAAFYLLLEFRRGETSTRHPSATPKPAAASNRAGRSALAWKPGEGAPLSFAFPVDDLKAPNYVEFWMHLPGRAESARLVVNTRGFEALGDMPLLWNGWRRILIPMSALRAKPNVKLEPGELRLTPSGEFPEGYTIHHTPPSIVTKPAGPGISDRDLLDHINLDLPELAAVREAMVAGDGEAALKALAAHFRQNLTGRMPLATPQDLRETIASAEVTLTGKLIAMGREHTFPGNNIDWHFNPTAGKPDSTLEWGYTINRHQWWERLAQAYAATKNDAYAACWAQQLRSWVEQCPAPAIRQEEGGSSWRGLEAGLRPSRIWLAAFFAFAGSPAVTDSDILLFLKSMFDHGNLLVGNMYTPGNHFMLSMVGLYNQSVALPELKDSAYWRKVSFDNISISLDRNTLPDMAWNELSPGYHQWVAVRAMSALEAASNNGGALASEKPVVEKMEKFAEWPVYLCPPNGLVPALNDGVRMKHISNEMSSFARIFPNNTLFKWATSPPESAEPPPFTSVALRDSGYLVSRTGWTPDDSYALLDVGPLGGWHGHQDALNLVVHFYGRPFLFDNGGWGYDTSEWRVYGPATASHNTAMVDGLNQIRTFNNATDPVGLNPEETPPARFGTSDKLDYASGWYVGSYGDRAEGNKPKGRSWRIARHRRETAFLKPASGRPPMMIVVDTFHPLDDKLHRYEVRWHVQSASWKSDRDGRHVWTTDEGQPNLGLFVLEGADTFHADAGVKEPELLGWDYPGQMGIPTPALTLRQTRTAAGPVRMVTLLVPSRPNQPPAILEASGTTASWTVALRDQPPLTVELMHTATPDAPSFAIKDLAWPDIK